MCSQYCDGAGQTLKCVLSHVSVNMFLNRIRVLTFCCQNYFSNFSTFCIQNVNNTGAKYVRIVKQTAFEEEKKRRVYIVFKILSTYIC